MTTKGCDSLDHKSFLLYNGKGFPLNLWRMLIYMSLKKNNPRKCKKVQQTVHISSSYSSGDYP